MITVKSRYSAISIRNTASQPWYLPWMTLLHGLTLCRDFVQLVLDDVPDRYFMARLNDAVDCERLIRSAGSFELKFFCPDPFGYAITDETLSIVEEGVHTITRTIGNIESLPVYRIKGVITAGASNYISITGSTNRKS